MAVILNEVKNLLAEAWEIFHFVQNDRYLSNVPILNSQSIPALSQSRETIPVSGPDVHPHALT
jgi:hypothetical protein